MKRTSKHVWLALTIFSALATTGCDHVPAFNLLGSYFPSWILCTAAGVIVTLAVHALFVRLNLIAHLWSLAIVYPALVCLVTCSLWLVFFS